MMKLITMVIQLTPYGVFCLMVKLGATVGWVEIGKVLGLFLDRCQRSDFARPSSLPNIVENPCRH
jgi:hypothetical protein